MNYQYVIESGLRTIKGLIPCGELPDLRYNFDKEAKSRGMTSRTENGVLIAERKQRQVRMKITRISQNIPSEPYMESLKLMMNEVLKGLS